MTRSTPSPATTCYGLNFLTSPLVSLRVPSKPSPQRGQTAGAIGEGASEAQNTLWLTRFQLAGRRVPLGCYPSSTVRGAPRLPMNTHRSPVAATLIFMTLLTAPSAMAAPSRNPSDSAMRGRSVKVPTTMYQGASSGQAPAGKGGSESQWKPEAKATLWAAVLAFVASLVTILMSLRVQSVLAAREASLQIKLQSLDDALQRSRSRDTSRRRHIEHHLEEALNDLALLTGLAETVRLQSWVDSNRDLSTEMRFRSARRRLELHLRVLAAYRAVPPGPLWEVSDAVSQLNSRWTDLLSEAAKRDPQFETRHPTFKAFSEGDYYLKGEQLISAAERLQKRVGELPSLVRYSVSESSESTIPNDPPEGRDVNA